MNLIHGNSRPIEILLVEDNPGDARLTQEALRAAKLQNNMTIVEYVTKPVDLDQFMRVVKAIDDFWVSVVTLPRE